MEKTRLDLENERVSSGVNEEEVIVGQDDCKGENLDVKPIGCPDVPLRHSHIG